MNDLGFLEKLLDGAEVEWLPLGMVTEYEQPTKYLVTSKNYDNRFLTPVLTAGKTFVLGYTDEKSGIYRASISPTIIFDDFTTANKWVDFDFKAKSSAMKMITSSDEQRFNLKYIYYWLNTLPSGLVDSDHKRQWISEYAQKRIPIPCPSEPEKSLAIQGEIARILDSFTEVTAELTTELAARKKQYNYYRNQLLTFEEGEVEWKALGDIVEVRSGWGFPAKFQGSIEGRYPFYKVSDMNLPRNGAQMTDANNRIDDEVAKKLGVKPAPSGTTIFPKIGAAIATNKKRLLAEESAYDNNVMGLIPSQQIDPRFLFYWLQTIDLSRWANDSGAVPSIRKSTVEAVELPVPSLSEQARIVEILDTFDTLTTSLNEGLPREIALRQQQYEHYRDLLLTFRKPEEAVEA